MQPQGKDMKISFSSIPYSISSYIPQIKVEELNFPLIVCDIDNFDDSLYDWQDPQRDYQYYCLTNDVKEVLGPGVPYQNAFSRVRHYDPRADDD